MSTMTANKAPEFTARELTERVTRALIEHELWDFGWKVRIGNALTQLGSCHYQTKTITVSLALANLFGEVQLEDTILHEIAHAIAGPQAGHGAKWKRVCLEIGASPNRLTEVPPELNKHTFRWESRCPHCAENRDGYKPSLTRRRGRYICAHCKNERNMSVRIEYRSISNPANGWNPFYR